MGLGTLYACEMATMVYAGVRVNLSFDFDDTCLIDKTPRAALGVVYALMGLSDWCDADTSTV